MSKHGRKRSTRKRTGKNRRFRGGAGFGATQWGSTMAGSNITAQNAAVGMSGSIEPTQANSGFPGVYQGGRRGGSIGAVLAQGSVPAALWASQYMYGKNKRNVYSRGRNSGFGNQGRKTRRRYR